jgi:hypothetical protein
MNTGRGEQYQQRLQQMQSDTDNDIKAVQVGNVWTSSSPLLVAESYCIVDD